MHSTPSSPNRLFTFAGSANGSWRVEHIYPIVGETIAAVPALSVIAGSVPTTLNCSWMLRGITSNERYVVSEEKSALVRHQQGLGRPTSRRAALIPIRKSAAWWALAQDERREIFEAQSHHIGIGMRFLPAIARKLHHCRDLGPDEPFDFLTWFEFTPADTSMFDELLRALRTSPEWAYVDREIDIRLVQNNG